ncbi:reverse transcriptase domain-containing protein [Tanacetum coccineum]
MPPKRNNMSTAAIDQLIAQHVADALAEYEANRNSENGNENDTGNGSHDSGTENRSTLFMESVFHINNCTLECQVKYATCTLFGGALTWWNSHVRTIGHHAAYEMPWKTLMKKMTEAYCLRSEIKKLEIELWNLKVKGTDVVSYTQHFQELALLCARMLPEKSDKVEKYTGGLADNIQGNVMSARPKTLQEAIELANDLMNQKFYAYIDRQADNKRSMDNNSRDNNAQQPPYKRKNVARAYSAGLVRRRISHLIMDCRSPTAVNNQRTLTCFECGNQGYYRIECPKLKNQNRGNQAGSSEKRGRVYALRGGEADQSPINVEDEADA